MKPSVAVTLIIAGAMLFIAPMIFLYLHNTQISKVLETSSSPGDLSSPTIAMLACWIAGGAALFVAIRSSVPLRRDDDHLPPPK